MSLPLIIEYDEIDFNELEDYQANPLVICRKKFVTKISSPSYAHISEDETEQELPFFDINDWYPYCNSYYPCSDEVDPFARVNHLLSTKASSVLSSASLEKPSLEDGRKHYYSTRDCQVEYLSSKPLCFLILGKPSIGEEELGKRLADYWQCVYIDPETLIKEEMESGSRAGQCIEFNLRCGRAIGIDVILRLVEKRVNTASVNHRGFVLCGLPVIPNILYEEDPVSAESAVFTVQEIFEEILESIYAQPSMEHLLVSTPSKIRSMDELQLGVRTSGIEWGEPQSEKSIPVIDPGLPPRKEPEVQVMDQIIPPDLGDSRKLICEPPEIGTNYAEQLNAIMKLFHEPFIIIYMVCENQDVINKRADYRYDIYSETVIDLQKERAERNLYKVFTNKTKLVLDGIDDPTELFLDFPGLFKDSSDLIHLVKLPGDFPGNVQTQLERFHDIAAKLLEARILNHNPDYFLKVDARTSMSRIFNSVKWKLRIFNFHRVLIPEKILDAAEDLEGEGSHSAAQKKLKYENLKKALKDLATKKIVSPIFKWELSDWGTKCPVAMMEGDYIDGQAEYAVHFMNNIFFLSTYEAFLQFHRNPRPFLLPPNPRPHGKIFVIGPGCSGKTAVSNCLAYLLNCNVLSQKELNKHFVYQRLENLNERMRQAMITDKLTSINADLIRKHQLEKLILKEKIEAWLNKFRVYIEGEYMKSRKSKPDPLKLSSFPVLMGASNKEEVKKEVEFEGIFLTETVAQDLYLNPERMNMYLPEELRRVIPDLILVSALEEPVLIEIEEYVKNADVDEIVLGEEDLLEMYSSAVRQEEERYISEENCKGGWILDGIPYDFNFFQRVYDECPPNHVIILEDTSELSEFLLDRFKTRGMNSFNEYREFFRKIGEPEVVERIDEKEPENLKQIIVRDILEDILTQKEFLVEPGDDEDIPEKTWLSRRESQTNYQNQLNAYTETKTQILDFLTTVNKDVIVVDVKDKSLENLLEEVVSLLNDKYRITATLFTDMDRLQEARDFSFDVGHEEGGEGMDKKGQEEFEMNRRYGDTYHYCPVTFHDKWVLWKGKQNNAAQFQGKLYLCSSEEDLKSFISYPKKYLPISKPFPAFPPPRICIVGKLGSGKTTISKAISKNFGLCHSDYMNFLKKKGSENENSEYYQQIQDYLNSDVPLPEAILKEYLYTFWYQEPYKSIGFVLDDFPKRPSDLTVMMNHKTLPDLIIYLKASSKELLQRVMQKELAEWQLKMEQARLDEEDKHLEHLVEWGRSRQQRFDQLMEERRQLRYSTKKLEKESRDTKPPRPYLEDLEEIDEETDKSIRSKSQVSFDSVGEQADIEEVTKLLNEEMPEPVFQVTSANIEDETARIKDKFENMHYVEIDFFKNMRDLCLAAGIQWEEIKSERSLEVTQYEGYILVNKFTNRGKSFFERTYDISLDMAERLLNTGYYFLSSFGRTCPVQYFKGDIPIQLFLPMEQKFNVFPIIHRQYIYFIVGKESREEFRKNPLKYVDIKKFKFPMRPVRIAIIGPPKCGKSVLADRFHNELGLKVVTKGQASRYVMTYLADSTLCKSMESRLEVGLDLKEKMVLSCVEASMYDPRAVSQGVVMDGFPNSAKEVKYLTSMGLMPYIVIDLYTEDRIMYDYVSSGALKRYEPPYSKRFLEHRYDVWESDEKEFRTWLDREYQNMVRVPINTCMWDVWEKANEFVMSAVYEIKHYDMHSRDDWPLRLANMLVSPLEFMERQSGFKYYCPCCLYYSKQLTSGGFPPDRTGLVHFRKHFYYICPEHIEEFLDTPGQFLSPYNPNTIPDNLPIGLELSIQPEDCYEDGYCVVCYHDTKQGVKGNFRFAAEFENVIYIFDSLRCQVAFLASPFSYADTKILLKSNITYPTLSYKDLPPLGTLEQFVAKDVIKAIKSTTSIRPVVPGLTTEQSALLTVAIFLKLNNKRLKKYDIEGYTRAIELMNRRRKALLQCLEIFKNYRNPFIYYEEPVPPLKISEWIKDIFGRKVASWSYTDVVAPKAFQVTKEPSEDFGE